MGCDIHLYREEFIRKEGKGRWVCTDYSVDNWDFDLEKSDKENLLPSMVDVGRDYEFFAFIAQVRGQDDNGFEPRGLPKDCSEDIRKESNRYGEDGHSHSYLTVKELKDKLESDITITVSGVMPKGQKKKLMKSIEKGEPNWDLLYPHCAMTTQKGFEEFAVEVPIKQQFYYIYKKLINPYSYMDDEYLEKIRYVFWFDN